MRRIRPAWVALVLAAALSSAGPGAQELTLPLEVDSVRFAIIGDSGTGERGQYEVAKWMAEYHRVFPYTFVIMMGDNLYGDENPRDFVQKFETPYKPLLDAGVNFYASLGNHDKPEIQRYYRLFNMGGERYYSFQKGPAHFFALDSNYMDAKQVAWLDKELSASTAPWKIAFFHHPIYSSGARHGSEVGLRRLVEPLLIKYGVSAVFAGHEHFYERLHPQNGIHYFTSGGAGKLRKGNIRRGRMTAAGFDTDLHFMIAEIAGETLHFQTISRLGKTVDAGQTPVRARSPAVTSSAQRR
jgi:3',5'-cyclic AMP phosphodiesterase CpdA